MSQREQLKKRNLYYSVQKRALSKKKRTDLMGRVHLDKIMLAQFVKKFLGFYGTQMLDYLYLCISPQWVCILSQLNPVHTLPSYLFLDPWM
jgi:hypothetical protein